MSWNHRLADHSTREVIYWPEDADFNNFARVRGGNPILFPFSARTFNEGTIAEWKDSDGTVRPMPMHGFSRGGAYDIVAIDETGFTAALKPTAADKKAYPFDHRFTVRYVFGETSVKVYLRLENLGDTPICWSAGHHFYFRLPWRAGLTRDDYRFEIPAEACYTHEPDGTLQPVEAGWKAQTSFGNPVNTDRIYTRLTGDAATFGPNDGSEDIRIRFLDDSETRSEWNAVVIWTESRESPFYCVEPWMGPPNSPEHGKGLHTVQAGETATFGIEVTLVQS